MGSFKERAMEEQYEQYHSEIAKKIGITYDEYQELETHIDDSDGTGTYLVILPSSPKNIVDKIKGLDHLNRYKLEDLQDNNEE